MDSGDLGNDVRKKLEDIFKISFDFEDTETLPYRKAQLLREYCFFTISPLSVLTLKFGLKRFMVLQRHIEGSTLKVAWFAQATWVQHE
jgi:hypothetical protein